MVKFTTAGVTFSSDPLLTYNDTGIISGLFAAPGAVTVTAPLQLPTGASDALIKRAIVPGVAPLGFATERKLLQLVEVVTAE